MWLLYKTCHTQPLSDASYITYPNLCNDEMYSGVYARVALGFYAYNSNGNRGIAVGLQNVQKIKDGEYLGGKTTASSDFGTYNDEFLEIQLKMKSSHF